MITLDAMGMRLVFFYMLQICETVSRQHSDEATKTIVNCNSNGHPTVWGEADPNVFHICDPKTNISMQLHCPEGYGYFNGLGYYGCIPYKEWPACIPPKVQQNVEKIQCDSEHLLEPWQTSDPNKFYMCTETSFEPLLVNCEIGKGFLSISASSNAGDDDDGGVRNSKTQILGCAPWAKWRSYMHCEGYY